MSNIFLATLQETPFAVKVACGTVICGFVAFYIIYRNKHKKKRYPPGIVILHQMGRGPYAPSLTPFAIKLETYLRMANTPYKNIHSFERSSKGKFPWIEYNGSTIGDTHFIIKYLNETNGIDLNSHLDDNDKSLARAFQKMLEENTYWTYVALGARRQDLKKKAKILKVPTFIFWFLRRKLKSQVYQQGMGRHNEEEVFSILTGDLKALSTFLGKKMFFFGDEPCETDCAIFGMLTVPYYHSFGDGTEDVIKKFSNLCEYCERMKTRYWPDWDDCITHGGTKPATK